MADFHSRLLDPVSSEYEAAIVHSINEFTEDPCGDIPLSAEDVTKATNDDSLLTTLIRYVWHGWHQQHDDCFAPYFRVLHELSIEQGVLL